MKQLDIIKVLAKDLGTTDVVELNKLLKAKENAEVKYRITSESLGHYGFTGPIKNITADGLKVYAVNKVSLIRFSEMTGFEKAKPRVERPKRPKEEVVAEKPPKEKRKSKVTDDDGYGDLIRRTPIKGSKFIPKGRK